MVSFKLRYWHDNAERILAKFRMACSRAFDRSKDPNETLDATIVSTERKAWKRLDSDHAYVNGMTARKLTRAGEGK